MLCRRQIKREMQFGTGIIYWIREIVSKFIRLPRHLILHLCEMMDNDLKRATRGAPFTTNAFTSRVCRKIVCYSIIQEQLDTLLVYFQNRVPFTLGCLAEMS